MTTPADPHARARAAWEDRHGSLVTERDRWFRAFLAMAAAFVFAVGFAVWAAVRTEYIPYIVAVDELGRTAPVIAPREISQWPDAAVRREVSDFIRDWRAISTDTAVMRGRLRRIHFFLEENSPAQRKIVTWATAPATDPRRRAEAETVDIEVHSVVSMGGRTWLAEWSEMVRPRGNGQVSAVTRHQGTFVLGKRRITDEALLRWNPFGMVVEDIDVVRLDR